MKDAEPKFARGDRVTVDYSLDPSDGLTGTVVGYYHAERANVTCYYLRMDAGWHNIQYEFDLKPAVDSLISGSV